MSWFEASAYAAFAGKSLPAVAQWYRAAPSDVSRYIVPLSNMTSKALAPVGAYKGVGGSFTLTATLDEVDTVSATQPCNGTGAFLSQAIVISGPGSVSF